MTKEKELLLLTLIKLLQEETSCLYSVLSECQEDKSHYVQYNRAMILREAIDTLWHKV